MWLSIGLVTVASVITLAYSYYLFKTEDEL